ncbi:hypothetical protein C0585_01295 [Candidatus Woesearchaeota archaeon]|nr:MAG: hypothetical protein C0585_01295 [Candidatus Woesearchaeota archaeon]
MVNLIKTSKANMNSFYHILKSKIFNKNVPLMVNFIITEVCNSSCKYCNIPSIKKRKKEMNTKEIKKMIDNLQKKGLVRIHITGGEPLLRKDIGEIIDHAKKKKVMTFITTNSKLIEEKIEKLKNLDLLFLCLNGKKKNHDVLRGKGNYDLVIKSINLAKKNNINLALNMILTNNNLEDVDHVVDIARQNNIKINFTPVFNNDLARADYKDIKSIRVTDEALKKVFSKLILLKKKEGIVLNSLNYLRFIEKNGLKEYPEKKCVMGKLGFVVNPDGGVVPCYKYVDSKKILTNGVKDGWEKAITNTKVPNCNLCNHNNHIEQNRLLNFSFNSLLNLFENYNIFEKRK